MYRETEVPLRNMEMRRRYKHQITDSNAVLTVVQVINDCINFRENLPEEILMMNYSEDEINIMIVRKLKLPLQILELLICNQENAIKALKMSSLI